MSVDWVLDPNSGEMRPVEALSPAVLERFDKPRNYGPLESFNGHARITGPCGDTMEFWIQVTDKRIIQCRVYDDRLRNFSGRREHGHGTCRRQADSRGRIH